MYTKCEHDRAYMPSSKSDISEYVFFFLSFFWYYSRRYEEFTFFLFFGAKFGLDWTWMERGGLLHDRIIIAFSIW